SSARDSSLSSDVF
nr:immunoglobulin light chain junction region [Macaca mulatta]MPO11229.1 immunoglobulin light chain junction region [Macaca mulatta]